jgi:hypothetical protein
MLLLQRIRPQCGLSLGTLVGYRLRWHYFDSRHYCLGTRVVVPLGLLAKFVVAQCNLGVVGP